MSSGKDIQLVVFDLNGTLIAENSWHDLNLALGISEDEDARLLAEHTGGKITYPDGQKQLETWYKERGKATKAIIEQVLYTYTYLPHVRETVTYLRGKGYELAIVSGSIDILVRRISSELHIHLYAANNSLRFGDDGMLSALDVAGDDRPYKVSAVREFAGQLGIPMTACAAVGDSENDRDLFIKTGKGITFKGSPVADASWRVIEDLSGIREIL